MQLSDKQYPQLAALAKRMTIGNLPEMTQAGIDLEALLHIPKGDQDARLAGWGRLLADPGLNAEVRSRLGALAWYCLAPWEEGGVTYAAFFFNLGLEPDGAEGYWRTPLATRASQQVSAEVQARVLAVMSHYLSPGLPEEARFCTQLFDDQWIHRPERAAEFYQICRQADWAARPIERVLGAGTPGAWQAFGLGVGLVAPVEPGDQLSGIFDQLRSSTDGEALFETLNEVLASFRLGLRFSPSINFMDARGLFAGRNGVLSNEAVRAIVATTCEREGGTKPELSATEDGGFWELFLREAPEEARISLAVPMRLLDMDPGLVQADLARVAQVMGLEFAGAWRPIQPVRVATAH